MSTINRRQVLTGAATVALGAPLLTACGDDGGSTGAGGGADDSAAAQPSADRPSSTPSSQATTPQAPRGGLVATQDVPVGGGVVIGEEEVVVTQPSEGEFKAYSAICTHQGCLLARVTDQIECDCHGSFFSIADGSPTAGPASAPLAAVDITVSGQTIELA